MPGIGRQQMDYILFAFTDTYRAEGQDRLGEDIRWAPPVLLKYTLRDLPELDSESGGELGVAGSVMQSRSARLGACTETSQFVLHTMIFGTLTPYSRPVDIRMSAGSSTNHVEHVLGGIGVGRAGRATVADEVVDQGLRVLANLAKVDRPPSLGEEEQPVESLEEHCGGLVDGAEDGLYFFESVTSSRWKKRVQSYLAAVGQLFHEVADGPRGLAVKT